MGGYGPEAIVPVDIDRVMGDEALKAMPDGPAKRFLHALARQLDYDEGETVPQLIVRRAAAEFDPKPRMN